MNFLSRICVLTDCKEMHFLSLYWIPAICESRVYVVLLLLFFWLFILGNKPRIDKKKSISKTLIYNFLRAILMMDFVAAVNSTAVPLLHFS